MLHISFLDNAVTLILGSEAPFRLRAWWSSQGLIDASVCPSAQVSAEVAMWLQDPRLSLPPACPLVPYAEGDEAIRRFMAVIPASAAEAVKEFPAEESVRMLDALARLGQPALDLLDAGNHALFYLLATVQHWAPDSPLVAWEARQAALAGRRRDLLAPCGVPATSAAIKMLQKVPPEACSPLLWRAIAWWGDAAYMDVFRKIPQIGSACLELSVLFAKLGLLVPEEFLAVATLEGMVMRRISGWLERLVIRLEGLSEILPAQEMAALRQEVRDVLGSVIEEKGGDAGQSMARLDVQLNSLQLVFTLYAREWQALGGSYAGRIRLSEADGVLNGLRDLIAMSAEKSGRWGDSSKAPRSPVDELRHRVFCHRLRWQWRVCFGVDRPFPQDVVMAHRKVTGQMGARKRDLDQRLEDIMKERALADEEILRIHWPAVTPLPEIPGAIEFIRTPEELSHEGQEMGHCAQDRMFSSNSFFYRIWHSRRHGTRRATLEIHKAPTGRWGISDLKGRENSDPSPATKNFVEKWLEGAEEGSASNMPASSPEGLWMDS